MSRAPPSDGRGRRTLPRGAIIDGRYRVQGSIGRGGMAIVYEAIHVDLGRVAVKVLLEELCDSAVLRERFAREARAAVKLQGEHVARVLDTGNVPETGAPYLVMEYLEGQDLRRELSARGPLPVRLAVDWVLQACAGLAEAHGHGLVHRDLKPSNLFLAVGDDGVERVKVLDFGIAKASSAEEVDMGLTLTGDVFGSPRYMSPEQLRASARVDARSDVWSLGVVLFELLEGQPPFTGGTPPEVHAEVLAGTAPRLSRADAPEGLRAVIARCLEKEPARRFAGVVALARALVPFGPPGAEARIARLTGAEAAIEVRDARSEPAMVARDPHTEPVFDEHADTPYTDIGHMRHALGVQVRAQVPTQTQVPTRTQTPPFTHETLDAQAQAPPVTNATPLPSATTHRTRRTRVLAAAAVLGAAPVLYLAFTQPPVSTPEGAGATEAAASAPPTPTEVAAAASPAHAPSASAAPTAVTVEQLAPASSATTTSTNGAATTSAKSTPARPKGDGRSPPRKPPGGAPPSLYEDRE